MILNIVPDWHLARLSTYIILYKEIYNYIIFSSIWNFLYVYSIYNINVCQLTDKEAPHYWRVRKTGNI